MTHYNLSWWRAPAPQPCETIRLQAEAHQQQLTKPAGSLGQLESLAIQLATIQGDLRPSADNVFISIFAGDHGIVAEGISAYPQSVTVEMQRNFVQGGAAISVLSKQLKASLEVVNCGTPATAADLPCVRHEAIAPQTQNFLHQEAMTQLQWEAALAIGERAITRAQGTNAQIFIGGEMGIGNTTAATAILASITGLPVSSVVGPGTGLDVEAVQRKTQTIEQALAHHQQQLNTAEAIARILGGFEIGALTGAYISAAQRGIAVIVDGFICTAAAAIAIALNASVRPYLIFSHRSAEPGHQQVLAQLDIEPILDMNLRLGEGSGAAVLVPIIRLACALHNEMATFADAQVSNKLDE